MNVHIKKYNKIAIIILIFSVVAGGVFYFFKHKSHVNTPMLDTPVLVSTRTVNSIALAHHVSAMGTLKSSNEVILTAQTQGLIESIHFQSGEFVNRGALLLTLKHNTEKTALAKAQADYEQVHDQFQRAQKLYIKHIIAQADIVQLKAKLKMAKANVEQARIAFLHCFIRAPFSGKLGIMDMSVGYYIRPGDPIIKLESMPVEWIDFSVSEKVASELINAADMDVYPENLPQKMSAKIAAIDSSVDLNTRSVKVRAKLDSDASALIPGSFAKIILTMPGSKMGIVIPQGAIQYQPYGASVYVVEQGRAKLRYIKTKLYQGDQMLVSSGLKAGDVIILLGQDKLREGQQVKIA